MAFGELIWMEGANCGLASPVIAVEAAVRVGDQDGAAGHMAELPAVWSATRRVLRAELARLQDAA